MVLNFIKFNSIKFYVKRKFFLLRFVPFCASPKNNEKNAAMGD